MILYVFITLTLEYDNNNEGRCRPVFKKDTRTMWQEAVSHIVFSNSDVPHESLARPMGCPGTCCQRQRYYVVNHQVIYNPAARHESRVVWRPTRDGLEHQRVVKGGHKDLLDIPSFLHYYKRRAMEQGEEDAFRFRLETSPVQTPAQTPTQTPTQTYSASTGPKDHDTPSQ